MSGIKDTATVILNVNGAQAKQMMADLEDKIKKMELHIATLKKNMADPKEIEKANKQLKGYKKQLDEMKSATEGVSRALENMSLSKATPRELEKALKTLNRQLKDMVPGTEVWNSHIEKIKALKDKLAEVRSELSESKTVWQRYCDWAQNVWPAIDLLSSGYDNFISYLRSYVNDFASIEQEMANVRKYTGLTDKQVEALNERFKEIDTRSSREELNKLAQEAGRLGKQSEEDILGFVRASDKINVALDDLGSGATLTLSKLTGIFGDEDKYGTEASLLKVGSVINELSQNCSASAPYIANFTERLGGVGAQAKMTIPQIMGFAAVLDDNSQKVEASATALSQVIVRLYQDPAKYAKVAGLDVTSFSNLMRKDANEALLLFLDTLNKAGGMDVLSPMFKDMGENGARAIAALSTLANNIGDLKAQQSAANTAFKEGISIDNEFSVQNNTVQASLDKCKNKANELSIELGKKLYPIMQGMMTTGSVIIRVLLTMLGFINSHKTAIISLTSAWALYVVALNASNIAVKLHTAQVVLAEKAQAILRSTTLLVSAAYNAVTGNITRATAAMKLFNASIKSNPLGMLLGLLTTAVTAFLIYRDNVAAANKTQKEISDTLNRTNAELRTEQSEIDKCFSALKRAKKGTKEYEDAKNKIINQYGQYLTGLIDEKKRLIDVEAAYLRVSAAARDAAIARGMSTAKKAVDDKFSEDDSKLMGEVEKKLRKYLKNQDDLGAIMQLIRNDLPTYHDISSQTGDIIREAINKGGKENSWDAIYGSIQAVGANYTKYDTDMKAVETSFGYSVNEFESYASEQLNLMYDDLANQISDKNNNVYELISNGMVIETYSSKANAAAALTRLDNARKLAEANDRSGKADTTDDSNVPSGEGYTHHETDKERKAREAAARRAAIKEKQEFKSELNDTKGVWEKESAQNTSDYSAGLKSWTEFLEKKHELEMQYFADREQVYEKYDLLEDEDYQALLKKKAEAEAEWLKRKAAMAVEDAKREQAVEEMQANSDFYNKESVLYKNEEALQMRLFDIKVKYMKKMQAAYNKDSQEWHDYQLKIEDAEGQESLRRKKLLVSRMAEWRKSYEYLEAGKRMYMELELLIDAYAEGLISYEDYLKAKEDLRKKYRDESVPDSAKPSENSQEAKAKNKDKDLERVQSLYDQGLLTEEEYNKARERIEKGFFDSAVENARRFGSEQTNQLLDIYVAWQDFFNSTEEDGGNWATRLAALSSSVFAVMNAGMQMASELISAQADIDVAVAEKKYDREIELAQGNSYKVAKLEKKKEAEIAKIKSEASKKQYAMQVIQAVAQTATNALNAYGSAVVIPVVGKILAPIAAAMAVAQGMAQVAIIKKQQQAAEAKGYSQGGYTKPGAVDEPAGIVHAGEWVASQRLLASPVARPMIEVLDKAQRTNTIGCLRFDQEYALPSASSEPAMSTADTSNLVLAAAAAQMSKVVSALHQRLNEPFVTVNTVTGDKGIKSAQDEYSRLISNKSPKSRR